MIETRMRKGLNGWKAETFVDLADNGGDKEEGTKRQLRITTSKHNAGGLATYVAACTVGGGFVRSALFRDFHKLDARSADRCTEKNVEAQHKTVLASLDDLIAEAIAYEAAKQQEEA
jgi:hypothetical protein